MNTSQAEKIILDAKDECRLSGKTTLEQMLDAVQFSANHFETEQRARIIVGSRIAPDILVMTQVCRLDDLGRLIEAMINKPREVARRLNGARK